MYFPHKNLLFVVLILAFTLSPFFALAHQPRIVESEETIVTNPEISKAYYGKLTGDPHVYRISAKEPFILYVNVLVPDIAEQKKDVSAAIIKDGDTEAPVAVLEGINFEWKPFWEEFGRDRYFMGPEYKARANAGEYEIRVWSSNNDSKYSLVIGETERFGLREGLDAILVIPKIKQQFFGESSAGFIFSPFGYGYILSIYAIVLLLGVLYYAGSKKFITAQELRVRGRLVCVTIGVGLFAWGIATSWNPVFFLFSGLAFFISFATRRNFNRVR